VTAKVARVTGGDVEDRLGLIGVKSSYRSGPANIDEIEANLNVRRAKRARRVA
jgi:hypothetical protein